MTNDKKLIENLAVEFSNILKGWLTLEQIKEVNRLNKTIEYKNGSCATHNYCDSNEALNEAFIKVLNREFIFYDDTKPDTEKLNQRDIYLSNELWTLAKTNNFYI